MKTNYATHGSLALAPTSHQTHLTVIESAKHSKRKQITLFDELLIYLCHQNTIAEEESAYNTPSVHVIKDSLVVKCIVAFAIAALFLFSFI